MVRGRAQTESVHKQLIHPNNCQRAFESSTATYTGDGKYYLVTKKKKKEFPHTTMEGYTFYI